MGLFDKALLFHCEQLTQLPAPIMTSLNEHLPEDAQWTKATERGGNV